MNYDQIIFSKRPESLFGDTPNEVAIKAKYNHFAKRLHPDHNTDPKAAQAMTQLNVLYDVARKAISAGTYGTPRAPLVNSVVISSRRHAYKVHELLQTGPVANIYKANDEEGKLTTMKVARSPKHNDLIAREASNLKKMLSDKATFDLLSPYLPEYIETFGYRDPKRKGKPHQASTFRAHDGFYTLAYVLSRRPALDPRDAAWIFRRLLYALAFAHSHNIVHANINPDTVLIHPGLVPGAHGLVIVDWEFSADVGTKPLARNTRHHDFLAPELRDPATHEPYVYEGTDLWSACELLELMCGGWDDTIPQYRAFIRGCTRLNPKARPRELFTVLDNFTDMIERLWGPRKFRPFAV